MRAWHVVFGVLWALVGATRAVTPPLVASGAEILDATGEKVRLQCVNWYGAEEMDFVVGGLDRATVADVAALIAAYGFNCVRLPYSVEMVLRNPTVGANVTQADPQWSGQPALDVYAGVVAALTARGVMVIVDNHMSDANWCCSLDDGNGLWYTDRWSEAQWLHSHSIMARRFGSNKLVVGADLRNELRSSVVFGRRLQPTWGTGDTTTDWAIAAGKAAAVIHEIAPHWLVIVEGLDFAGNLTGVRAHPLTIPQGRAKLVYEAHNYASFFTPTSAADFARIVHAKWGFILEPGQPYTAPVWLGEFGTCHSPPQACFAVDASSPSPQAQWFTDLHAYIAAHNMSWGYWAIDGTESRGTGRVAGSVETYGVLNTQWNGPAAGGALLHQLQALMSPTRTLRP